MKNDKEAFDLLCRAGEVSGPVEDAEINRAEAELGVRFPSEYRDFLQTYGAVVAKGIEVYGLLGATSSGPPLWQDVVAVTKKLRDWKQAGTENNDYVVISEDGFGNYVFLDTSANDGAKIFLIGPDASRDFDVGIYRFFINISEGKAAP